MCTLVVPTLSVNRVGAKHLQFPLLDLPSEYLDHPAIFVFKKLAHRSREDKKGRAYVPEDEHLHFPVQFLAVTLVVFTIHGPEYLTRTCFRYTWNADVRQQRGSRRTHRARRLAAALVGSPDASAGASGCGIFR